MRGLRKVGAFAAGYRVRDRGDVDVSAREVFDAGATNRPRERHSFGLSFARKFFDEFGRKHYADVLARSRRIHGRPLKNFGVKL